MRRHLALLVLPFALAGVALGACGSSDAAPTSTSSTTPGSVTVATPQVVTPSQGKDIMIREGASLTLIDVRTADEFAAGHIDGAVNMDIEGGQFSKLIADLPKDGQYMVYCHSGRRSAIAAQAMVEAGFHIVYDLGGIAAWQDAGYPVVTG